MQEKPMIDMSVTDASAGLENPRHDIVGQKYTAEQCSHDNARRVSGRHGTDRKDNDGQTVSKESSKESSVCATDGRTAMKWRQKAKEASMLNGMAVLSCEDATPQSL